jgi:hypothetical protein
MRRLTSLVGLTVLGCLLLPAPAGAQKQGAQSPRIQSAKTIYFRNLTGSDAVGKDAVAQLKKWGKYQLVADPQHADLVLILTADVYNRGTVDLASGQTGSVGDTEDPVPTYTKESPTRYAYLTVIDRRTGEPCGTTSTFGEVCSLGSTVLGHGLSRS